MIELGGHENSVIDTVKANAMICNESGLLRCLMRSTESARLLVSELAEKQCTLLELRM